MLPCRTIKIRVGALSIEVSSKRVPTGQLENKSPFPAKVQNATSRDASRFIEGMHIFHAFVLPLV